MSSAFVKEGEYQQLKEVAPNVTSLLIYLRRENGGAPVRELKRKFSEKYRSEVYDMSDGLSYALGEDGKWLVVLD